MGPWSYEVPTVHSVSLCCRILSINKHKYIALNVKMTQKSYVTPDITTLELTEVILGLKSKMIR